MERTLEIIGKITLLERCLRLCRLRAMLLAGGLDATRGRGRILTVVNALGEISPGDLAFILQIRLQSMNESLKKLEQAGLLIREPDGTDRRRTRIVLTEEGRACVPSLPGGMNAMLDCLTPAEQDQFSDYLDRVTEKLVENLALPEEAQTRMREMEERVGKERFQQMMRLRMGMGQAVSIRQDRAWRQEQ